MRGILADVNCEGHLQVLLVLLQEDCRCELWDHLGLTLFTFGDLNLVVNASDRVVGQTCQSEQVVLITANRNADDSDSLQATIDSLNEPESLPVLTLAAPERILRDRNYAERTADRLLDYLFDFEQYLGTGRLFLP